MEEPVASTFLGTRGYLAPEMLQRQVYTKAVDSWALGTLPALEIVYRLTHCPSSPLRRYCLCSPLWMFAVR